MLHKIAFVLLIVGGLNWGLYAFDYDLGKWLPESLMNVVYILVGLSALYKVFSYKSMCKECSGNM